MRCERCFRRCILSSGQVGICQAVAFDGKNILVEKPRLSTISIGPIEEKAIYHFRPGSRVLTAGFYNCNLRCSFCINHEISHRQKYSRVIDPVDLVNLALKEEAHGLALSFSEPMLYAEFVSETFRLAHQHGLYTALKTSAMVSSGLFTRVLEDTDVCCIDIKGDSSRYKESCGVDEKSLELLYENLQMAHQITNLELSVIIRDEEKKIHSILTDISGLVGALTPIHLVAFLPAFKETSAAPTTLDVMKMAHGIATIYFEYVYDESANSQTVCRECYTTLLKREGGVVAYNVLKGNTCSCGTPLWKKPCATITNVPNVKPSLK